jgi:hypothetical protein
MSGGKQFKVVTVIVVQGVNTDKEFLHWQQSAHILKRRLMLPLFTYFWAMPRFVTR